MVMPVMVMVSAMVAVALVPGLFVVPAVVAALVVTATEKGVAKPRFSISGTMKPPTELTAAAAEPEMLPKSMQVRVLT